MCSKKSLAQGFLVATGLIWVFNVAALVVGGEAMVGLMYQLIVLIPAIGITILKLKKPNSPSKDKSNRWRNLLFSFQGVALGFWLFDILTTFYSINVTRTSTELNPLGWPWGILGAFAFYGPTLVFSYVLLFRLKEKTSFCAALPLTLITLGMSVMNLVAGAQNFQVFVETASLEVGVRYGLLELIVAANLVVLLVLKWIVARPKQSLNLKKP
jgi:uncharacterized protein YhhL (DUF1145 family)